MKREGRAGTSRAMGLRDYPRRSAELPRGPKLYTDREIVERAGKRGTEAARKSKTDRRAKPPNKTDKNV